MRRATLAILAFLLCACLPAAAGEIPSRPEQLTFPPLQFELPDAAALRFVLDNGVPVYAKPSTDLPLISITVFFRGGQYLEPAGAEGLASITGDAWRTGGAGDRTAQQLDEDLDYLAAIVSTSIGDVTGRVSLNVLVKDLDPAMKIFMDVLTKPRFQEDRFAKAKDDLLQAMKTRNDASAAIEAREWDRLIYGDDFWMNRLPTKASVATLTPITSRNFAKRLIGADNLVVAVSGDFTVEQLKAMLNATLGTLPKLETPLPPIPQPTHQPTGGVWVVDKKDVNQGRVSIGEPEPKLGDPDEMPLRVMNYVLGGGGFTSRITQRVRSDEGLAYSAASSIDFPVTIPGEFRAFFQSKSSTVPFATKITLDLIRGMRTAPISHDELSNAQAAFVETFPRRFDSAASTVGTFAVDELLGRDHSYWTTFRDKIRAVTVAQVQEAAERHLHPDSMVILVVGNLDEIMAAHPEHPEKLSDFGEIHHLPLRDPMTLEPLPQ